MKQRLGHEWRDFLDDLPGNLTLVWSIAAVAFVVGWIVEDMETGAIYGGGGLFIGLLTVPLTWARYDRDEPARTGRGTTMVVLLVATLACLALLALVLVPLLLI